MTNKNKTIALILCVLLGYLGIHRFYVGKTKSGVVYLLTVGLCGIGWIVDIILICTDKFSGVAVPQNTSTFKLPQMQVPQSQAAHVPQPIQAQIPQPQVISVPQSVQTRVPQSQTEPVPQSVQTQAIQPQVASVPLPTQPQAASISTYMPMPCFLPFTDGKGLKYEYENDLCMINTTAAELGAKLGGEITFKQEPENTYDENAVAIWQDGRKLGYIYRGQSQEMANRWLKNSSPLLGFISHIDIPNNKIKYKIGFYESLEKMRKERFKLTGIRQKDALDNLRQDNLEYCSLGEALSIELDEGEKYIVWCNSGEIGVLPKIAEDFLGSKEKAVGILTKMDFDDDGKYTAEVEVYV